MKEQAKKKFPLAFRILAALIIAIIVGLCLTGHPDFAENWIRPFGNIFLNLVKFIVCPIVLFSIMCGIMSMRDIRKVGSIGWKALLYFFVTTAVALVIGIFVGTVFKKWFPLIATAGLEYQQVQVPVMDTIVNIFPDNFVAPLIEANMLQIIVMALLIGFGVVLVGEKAYPIADAFNRLNEIFMKVLEIIMSLSPIGVFCLLTPIVASNGPKVIGTLGIVLLAAYIAYFIHLVVVDAGSVSLLGGISPKKFFSDMHTAMLFAFSSASSIGTIPINMEACNKMGADPAITSFVLPLGATINMNGTSIYMGICSIFIASCYGIDLTISQMATIVVIATLASVGTAGVPGSGMVMLAMVLTSIGLPVEGIAIVAGIDRVFDMGRTVVNITGDACCAVVVSNIERKRDMRLANKAETRAQK